MGILENRSKSSIVWSEIGSVLERGGHTPPNILSLRSTGPLVAIYPESLQKLNSKIGNPSLAYV